MVDCDSERIWKIVESYRQNVPKRRHQSDSPPSLFDRLYDCYVECNQTSSEKSADKRFRNAVNLLERLNPSHAHPSLIVNLYPDEQGYSIVLSPKKGTETEEFFLPYEDNEIFSYLDNQELPPVLVEVLGQTEHCHMYNGCVVCEVRDHRSFSCPNGSYDRHLLLLRPTTETILSTVEELACENGCSAEEKLFLESKLLLATQPPICLDPSTDVVCFTNRLQYNQRKFHTPSIRRTLRKRSHARRARMHMTSVGMAPRGLQLHDFIAERTRTQPREKWREDPNLWKKPKVDHQLQDTPETILASVLRLTRRFTPPPESPLLPTHYPSGPTGTTFAAPRQPAFTTQPSTPHIISQPVSVPSEVPPVQRPPPPPHPPVAIQPPSHPQIPPHLPMTPVIAQQQQQQQQIHVQQPPPGPIPIQQPPHLAPPPPLATPPLPPPPTATPPSMAQLPVATIAAAAVAPPTALPIIATTAAASTIVTPPQASQPHPLTPTPTPTPPPSLVQQQHPVPPPAPITPPVSVTIATPTAMSQPPSAPQPSTSQPLYSAVSGGHGLQLPPGLQLPQSIAANPELLKLFLTQMQVQAAASAAAVAAAAGSRQNKPRPIAPALSVAKVTAAGTPVVVKSKPPTLVGTPPPPRPPPLSGPGGTGSSIATAASGSTVIVSRPVSSTMVQASPQMRPPLHSLTTPTPPSLTPSPKRPLPSFSSQSVSPAQAGMPKLHPLAQELSVPPQKTSLPPQPALSKPAIPPPPSLSSASTSVIVPGGGGNAPPPAMPTLHKISATPTPMPPPQAQAAAVPQQQHVQQQQQKAMPTMGGAAAIPTPPLKANPMSATAMPKLMTSLGQQVKLAPTGMPTLSRAPMPLQPPPGSRPHPQPRPLMGPQQTTSTTSSILSSLGFQLNPMVKIASTVAPPKLSHGTTAATSKSTKHGGSSGKSGKSHGSGAKKKKK